MTDRERLIHLLFNVDCNGADQREGGCSFRQDRRCNVIQKLDMCMVETIADHLLANGVIVPPCKVGDTVYVLDVFADDCKCADCDYYYAGGFGDSPECEKTRHGYRYHKCVEIIEQRATMQSILCWLSCDEFGKTVFLTREEAEKALAERNNDGKS